MHACRQYLGCVSTRMIWLPFMLLPWTLSDHPVANMSLVDRTS